MQEALAANQTFSNVTDVQNLDLQELRERGLEAATFPEADEVSTFGNLTSLWTASSCAARDEGDGAEGPGSQPATHKI